MTESVQKKLNDSAALRWTALVLLAGAMFFAYIFMDILSPLQALLQTSRAWTPEAFGNLFKCIRILPYFCGNHSRQNGSALYSHSFWYRYAYWRCH